MKLRIRKRIKVPLLPVFLNVTQRGLSSTSVKIGPWSKNSRRPGRSRLDLPGPVSLELGDGPNPGRSRWRPRLLLAGTLLCIPLVVYSHGFSAVVSAVAAVAAFTSRIL
jgi:hypothetical protein